jgi:formamidopyrimidine-DNA glycosylase
MPELPDVEVFRRYLEANGLHRQIRKVEVRHQRILRNISESRLLGELRGQSLEATHRHGKYLLVKLSGSKWLIFHFGMTGSLCIYGPSDDEPPLARLVLTFTDGYRLAYISQRMLGGIELVDDPDRFIAGQALGADILGDRFDAEIFRNVLAGKRSTSKAALMDQEALAGIGNVYSDEILFQAGIHPQRPVASLSDEEIGNLFRNMKKVLQTAIDNQADPHRFPATYLTRSRRAGSRCPNCGGRIEQKKIAGRTSYFCPDCQKQQSHAKPQRSQRQAHRRTPG